MKKIICFCDRCGEEIPDVVYTLTCYCETAPGVNPAEHVPALISQNERQNAARAGGIDRHLCRMCKDEVTDGVFIV